MRSTCTALALLLAIALLGGCATRSGREVGTAVTSGDILGQLADEHDAVTALLDQMASTASVPTRQNQLARLNDLLLPHMAGEEEAVYPTVLAMQDGRIRVSGLMAQDQHAAARTALLQLGQALNDTDLWSARVAVLREMVNDHIQLEEDQVFDALDPLDQTRMQQLWDRYNAAADAARGQIPAGNGVTPARPVTPTTPVTPVTPVTPTMPVTPGAAPTY